MLVVPFERTVCGCTECQSCCRRGSGPLLPGDAERITEYIGRPAPIKAGVGTTLGRRGPTGGLELVRIPSVVLETTQEGICVFYAQEEGLCAIHEVAPWGCAYTDVHMSEAEGNRRVLWYAKQVWDELEQARKEAQA